MIDPRTSIHASRNHRASSWFPIPSLLVVACIYTGSCSCLSQWNSWPFKQQVNRILCTIIQVLRAGKESLIVAWSSCMTEIEKGGFFEGSLFLISQMQPKLSALQPLSLPTVLQNPECHSMLRNRGTCSDTLERCSLQGRRFCRSTRSGRSPSSCSSRLSRWPETNLIFLTTQSGSKSTSVQFRSWPGPDICWTSECNIYIVSFRQTHTTANFMWPEVSHSSKHWEQKVKASWRVW